MKTKHVKILLSAAMLLLMAWGFSACSKKDDNTVAPADKTALTAELAVANNLIATTAEGTGNGEFPRGSQATLQSAIDASQLVANDPGASAATVSASLAHLTAAVATYNGGVIVPVDVADLVGQWTFDELTTSAVGTKVIDHSNLHNDGTIVAGHPYFSTAPAAPYTGYVPATNVPTQVADRYGDANKALHFTAGANVEIPYTTDLNPGQISISLWVKADSLPKYYANNYMVSMNRWNGYKFQIQDTPRAFFTAYLANRNSPLKGNASDSADVDKDMNEGAIKPLNAWYHLVVTLGGGHEVFYINGTLVYDWGANANEAVPGTIVNLNLKQSVKFSPVNLVIGQDLPTAKYTTDSNSPFYVNYGAYFIGALDDIRIYKSVLTAAQVSSIYTQEKP